MTWQEFGWRNEELPREPLDEVMRGDLDLPPTMGTVAGEDVRQRSVFDPSMKQYPNAYRAGDPVFDDPARTRAWLTARRAALDAVLLAVSESPWGDSLVLRGSVLLADWFGAAAREPGDLDFVVVPQSWDIGDGRTARMLAEIASGAAGRAGIKDAGAVCEGIWTYDRVPGTRMVLPWQVPGLPAGQVQLDFVFNERLPEEPERVELACGAEVLAASPALSLAWKLLWLVSDSHPQGKDLYDAVLLAERYPLPYALLDQVFRLAPEQPLRGPSVTMEDIAAYGNVGHEWRHFTAEYPHVPGSEEEYSRRLVAALAPTFTGNSANS